VERHSHQQYSDDISLEKWFSIVLSVRHFINILMPYLRKVFIHLKPY
jgi:hypothetical protein